MGEGVTKAPDDGRETAEVEWDLVPPYDLRSGLHAKRIHEKFVPLSYLIRGARVKAETTVGIPITRPEKVSPPPNRSA